jgi:hypothetical protein
MSIKDALQKATQNVRTRFESAVGRERALEPSTIRQEILDRIESRIVVETDSRVFPYGRVAIRLLPLTKAHRNAIEETLLRQGALKSDILQLLNTGQVRYPRELDILIEAREDAARDPKADSPPSAFEMDFVRLNNLRKQDIPETKLVILKGLTEQPEYLMKRDRILIGRSREVLDREGRMVRKNDIVFLENGEEINCSVGTAHARIWFNFEKDDFCILDEASRYGTRILRGGTAIDVPSGEPDGLPLRSGDDIYCGQACLRFMRL